MAPERKAQRYELVVLIETLVLATLDTQLESVASEHGKGACNEKAQNSL